MPVKIAICDDTPENILHLSDALLAYDPLFDIITFSNGKMLMDELLDGHVNVDLLF